MSDTGGQKTCAYCEEPFSRRTGIRWPETNTEWAGRRYCSRRCGLRDAAPSNPTCIAVDRPRLRGKLAGMHPDAVACRELLKRSILYGLRYNRHLGMGADSFMDRARELGLAA